ncbi:MAG: type II toxin-antitoxin system Phd/YefM family antitoxin [Mycobacterium sp.]|nr:type II toxin-antitoxin system Phd/YefM family antitoxin [Mycobacterium sp.]
MERIGVRELRQNASRYLAQVAADHQPIEITDRGRPVARLVPIAADDWENMVAAGEITPADSGVTIGDIEPFESGLSASEILQELREYER